MRHSTSTWVQMRVVPLATLGRIDAADWGTARKCARTSPNSDWTFALAVRRGENPAGRIPTPIKTASINGHPGNDMPAVIMALDARYRLRRRRDGEREIAAREFYGLGPRSSQTRSFLNSHPDPGRRDRKQDRFGTIGGAKIPFEARGGEEAQGGSSTEVGPGVRIRFPPARSHVRTASTWRARGFCAGK